MDLHEQRELLGQFLLWHLRDYPHQTKRELSKAAQVMGLDVSTHDVNSVLYGRKKWFRDRKGKGAAPEWVLAGSAPEVTTFAALRPETSLRDDDTVLVLSSNGKWT